jgi:sigma-B regulation protein RsbU (phosphoserine phosphatase)
VALSPGDSLLFYTDGVIEVRRDGQEVFGEADLRDVVARNGGAGAEALVAAVVEAAMAASEGTPRDDIAALVLALPSRGH